MSDIKNVVLVGATGTLGRHILRSLLASPFTITVLTRPTSTSDFPPSVRVVRASITDVPALTAALAGQDAVVSAVGVAAQLDQLPLITAAAAAGVRRFIPSDFGGASSQRTLPELEGPRGIKQKVNQHLVETAEKTSGFTWTALATGNFIDLALTRFPPFGFDIANRKAVIYDGGDVPTSATTMPDIATAVVGVLRNPGETGNRVLRLRSVETTQNELLKAFEEGTGEKWAVEEKDTGPVYEEGKRKLREGVKGAYVELVVTWLWAKDGEGRGVVVTRAEAGNTAVGVQEKTPKEIVKDVLGGVGGN